MPPPSTTALALSFPQPGEGQGHAYLDRSAGAVNLLLSLKPSQAECAVSESLTDLDPSLP